MHPSKSLEDIDQMFKTVNTKHLPVVERMVCDINRRMLKEKTISYLQGGQITKRNSQKVLGKSLTPPRKSSYLGEFYQRLKQDIEKRRVKSRIRQQIKKILDKRKGVEHFNKTFNVRPHLPHKFVAEEIEIEKLYGLPGKPSSFSYTDEESFVTHYYNFK